MAAASAILILHVIDQHAYVGRRRRAIQLRNKRSQESARAHFECRSDVLKDSLERHAIVKSPMGSQWLRGRQGAKEALQLHAAAVHTRVDRSEDFERVHVEPLPQCAEVEAVADTLATEKRKVEFHAVVRAYHNLRRVVTENRRPHLVARRIVILQGHRGQVFAEIVHAAKCLFEHGAFVQLVVCNSVDHRPIRKHGRAHHCREARSVLAQHADFDDVVPEHVEAGSLKIEIEDQCVLGHGRARAEE